VTDWRHLQESKAELWSCLTEDGIVITERYFRKQNAPDVNCQMEEGQSKETKKTVLDTEKTYG
jgi:hypothetical protein